MGQSINIKPAMSRCSVNHPIGEWDWGSSYNNYYFDLIHPIFWKLDLSAGYNSRKTEYIFRYLMACDSTGVGIPVTFITCRQAVFTSGHTRTPPPGDRGCPSASPRDSFVG